MKKLNVKLTHPTPLDVISKTDLINFFYCPYKCRLGKMGITIEKIPIIKQGIQFHKLAKKLFDRADLAKMKTIHSPERMRKYFWSITPELEDPIKTWYDNFLEHEAERWFNRRKWMPLYREHYVKISGRIQGLRLYGHIDRVDSINGDEVSILEYKPKVTPKLHVEIAFYMAVFNNQISESRKAVRGETYQYLKGKRVETRPSFRKLSRLLKRIKKSIDEDRWEKNYNSCNYCFLREECLTEEEATQLLEEVDYGNPNGHPGTRENA